MAYSKLAAVSWTSPLGLVTSPAVAAVTSSSSEVDRRKLAPLSTAARAATSWHARLGDPGMLEPGLLSRLTDRELQVVVAVSSGESVGDAAVRLLLPFRR